VARTLSDRRIHCVVVSGSPERDVWGVVSDLDLVRGAGADLDETTAGEVAATEVVTVAPSATLDEAAQLMAEHEVARLIVVHTETGRPMGVVSTLDLARAFASRVRRRRRVRARWDSRAQPEAISTTTASGPVSVPASPSAATPTCCAAHRSL
jgi:signal-transduction protein with cAMP-binding, CBS, and nucleotidyltransferase domain